MTTTLLNQVAFAPWGNVVRPIVVFDPQLVPQEFQDEQKSFPSAMDYQICCFIGQEDEMAYIPRKNIISFEEGTAKGYGQVPTSILEKRDLTIVERETKAAFEQMTYVLAETPRKRAATVLGRQTQFVF